MEGLVWQVMVFILILAAFVTAIWLAMKYQGWLRKRHETFPKWGAISVWICGFVLFVFLALFFGYMFDRFG